MSSNNFFAAYVKQQISDGSTSAYGLIRVVNRNIFIFTNCNIVAFLRFYQVDYKPLLYKGRWHCYCILLLTYLIMYYNGLGLFLSGVPAWR